MKVVLYHYPATRSARVAWLLHELAGELDYEIVPLDLYAGEQHHPDFQSRFPLHAVPAIEISVSGAPPITMTESGAIIVTLADAFPESELAPSSSPLSRARANYMQVIHECGASFDMMLWQIRTHSHILAAEQRDERTVARYCRKFECEAAPILLGRLAQGDYICGDGFTAADCMAAHVVMWARSYGLLQNELATAYLARVSKRSAFRQAFHDARAFDPVVPSGSPVQVLFSG